MTNLENRYDESVDIPDKLSEEESCVDKGLSSYPSDITDIIRIPAYDNDGEESG